MGKNLKGKECGKGIYQGKNELYSARYYSKNGKRKEKLSYYSTYRTRIYNPKKLL